MMLVCGFLGIDYEIYIALLRDLFAGRRTRLIQRATGESEEI